MQVLCQVESFIRRARVRVRQTCQNSREAYPGIPGLITGMRTGPENASPGDAARSQVTFAGEALLAMHPFPVGAGSATGTTSGMGQSLLPDRFRLIDDVGAVALDALPALAAVAAAAAVLRIVLRLRIAG